MATRARKINELPEITSIGANDLFIVESSSTSKFKGSNLKRSLVSGPFDDDPTAETGGVGIGEMYYNSTGDVKVRLV